MPPPAPVPSDAGKADENGPAHAAADGSGRPQQPRQQPPGQQSARGRGFKDKHKAAIANHHRKDRAFRKMAGPPV